MPRILFVKTSSLGDVVHHCPAVSDVARRFAGAEIDWVVEESFAGVAKMHRDVSGVIPVAVRRWRESFWRPAVWSEIAAFRRRIGRQHYDYVIDSQGLLKSALVTALAHGERHGLDAASAREPIAARFYDVTHQVRSELHPVERNRMLAAASLNYELNGHFDYGLQISGPSDESAQAPYVVLLSMTSRREKLWPSTRWVELAEELNRRGLRVLLPYGTEAERRRSERIAGKAANAFVPRRMAVDEVARLMKNARAVIGLDTGLLHLAVGLGVPAVGIFSGTDPMRFGVYGAPGSRLTRNVGAHDAAPSAAQVLAAFEDISPR
jgi:heptosyltransferase I